MTRLPATDGDPLGLSWALDASPAGPLLRAELTAAARCLSSSVLGGGLGTVRTWANLQVPSDYRRTDPEAHLAKIVAGLVPPVVPPVVGMLTAASLDAVQDVAWGSARVLATVGLGRPAAAATLPEGDSTEAAAGTINIFATVATPLTGAGLAGAFITAVEAKAQALAAAGVPAANASGPATGTATDALAIACPLPSAIAYPFCGPATPQGADLARAVFEAVLRGCAIWGQRQPIESRERRGGQ